MEFLHDIGGDPLKPSLFELIAQEQLRDLLQPALKYVLAVSKPSFITHLALRLTPDRSLHNATRDISSKSSIDMRSSMPQLCSLSSDITSASIVSLRVSRQSTAHHPRRVLCRKLLRLEETQTPLDTYR